MPEEFLPTTPGNRVTFGAEGLTFTEPNGTSHAEPYRDVIIGQGRLDALNRISELWRGDWSAREFDGKDGHRWIQTALTGNAEALRALDAELAQVEASYG